MRSLGVGVVTLTEIPNRPMRISYQGTFPPVRDGERVVVMRESDLKLMVESCCESLLTQYYEMPEELYSKKLVKDEEGSYISPPTFSDELDVTRPDGVYKLYLDRKFYSCNPKDMVWVRYVSVDQSIIEEGIVPPDGGVHEHGIEE